MPQANSPTKKRDPKWLRKWKRKERAKEQAFAECTGYSERNATLRQMGFATYRAYLASDLWAGIRARVLTECRECVLCKKPSAHVHHTGYGREVLAGEKLSPLKTLCAGCHHHIEFDGDRKRWVTEAHAVFQKLYFAATHPDHRGGLTKGQYIREKIKAKRASRTV